MSLDPFPIPPNSLPKIIVVISPQMNKNFKLYGENLSVCYDLTYNLIQDVILFRHVAIYMFTYLIPFPIGTFTEAATPNRKQLITLLIEVAAFANTPQIFTSLTIAAEPSFWF